MKRTKRKISFQVKPAARKSWLFMTAAGAAVLAFSFATGHVVSAGGTVFGVGLLMSIWSHRAEIVRLFPDHFELKLAPLASLHKVRYRDIERIDMLKKNVAKLTLRESKPIKIPLNILEQDAQDTLMHVLTEKRAA